MEKPDVDAIEGLSPAISIEQKSAGHNPRSTVGTVTEIYDYLRLLYARAGTPHCPNCGRPVERQSASADRGHVLAWPEGTKIEILAPLVRGRKGEFRDLFANARAAGLRRARSSTAPSSSSPTPPKLNRSRTTTSRSWWTVSRARESDRGRLTDSLETALKLADGLVEVKRADSGDERRSSPSATAAPCAASRCPSSSRASSPSIRRSARASAAAGSALNGTSAKN